LKGYVTTFDIEILNRYPADGWFYQSCYPTLKEAYYIQIAAFRKKKRAEKFMDSVNSRLNVLTGETGMSVDIVIKETQEFYKVLIGPFEDLENARLLLTKFPAEFEDAFIRLNKGLKK
jgi:cell division protein FtsN